MNRNQLHNAFTEVVAANLHQHEYPTPDNVTEDELQGWIDGWRHRYHNEGVFKDRVDTAVAGLICAHDEGME
jgi:hypothetical protein